MIDGDTFILHEDYIRVSTDYNGDVVTQLVIQGEEFGEEGLGKDPVQSRRDVLTKNMAELVKWLQENVSLSNEAAETILWNPSLLPGVWVA